MFRILQKQSTSLFKILEKEIKVTKHQPQLNDPEYTDAEFKYLKRAKETENIF